MNPPVNMHPQVLNREGASCDSPARFALSRVRPLATLAFAAMVMSGLPSTAHAVDGCKVLLCLTAPDWRQIPECVPDVTRALHDLHRGRPFPRCNNAGAGNTSDHAWSEAPWNCPPQYTHRNDLEDRIEWTCDYAGAVTVFINGGLFTRTWWNGSGDTVTQFSAAAKMQLGNWNTRYDDEYAAWLAAQPVAPTQPGGAE